MNQSSQDNSVNRPAQWAGRLTVGLLCTWLLVAACVVDVEYFDGLDVIYNTRHLLGDDIGVNATRAPIISVLVIPAELIRQKLQLHPLDVRPHHAVMFVVHSVYLIAVWFMLTRQFGHQWSTLIAFAAAVPCFIFFTYAPYLNHDIFPGAIFLLMLLLAKRFIDSPRAMTWLLMVALGAAAALTKQYMGHFWAAIVIGAIVTRAPRKPIAWMIAGAITSGVITWLTLGIFLAPTWSIQQILIAPWLQIQAMFKLYDGTDVTFPWWVYLRNTWSYGVLVTVLIIPGLVLSLRGSKPQRMAAVAWIVSIVLMHMTDGEVRYIAFLLPVSAFVIVPVLEWFGKRKLGWVVLVFLAIDLCIALPEAARIGHGFYTDNQITEFLAPLEYDKHAHPVLMNRAELSFNDPDHSPLAGERYHRLFHIGSHHIRHFYGYTPDNFKQVDLEKSPDVIKDLPDGTILVFGNTLLANEPTWTPRGPGELARIFQSVAVAQTLDIKKNGDSWQLPSGHFVEVRSVQQGDQTGIVIGGLIGGEELDNFMFPIVSIGNDPKTYVARPAAAGYFHIVGLTKLPDNLDSITFRGFAIKLLTGTKP